MIQTLSRVGIEGTYLNIIRAIHDKLSAYIMLNKQKLQALPLRLVNKTGISAFTSLIQHSTEVLAIAIREEEEIRSIQIGKEEIKLSLSADDMIRI